MPFYLIQNRSSDDPQFHKFDDDGTADGTFDIDAIPDGTYQAMCMSAGTIYLYRRTQSGAEIERVLGATERFLPTSIDIDESLDVADMEGRGNTLYLLTSGGDIHSVSLRTRTLGLVPYRPFAGAGITGFEGLTEDRGYFYCFTASNRVYAVRSRSSGHPLGPFAGTREASKDFDLPSSVMTVRGATRVGNRLYFFDLGDGKVKSVESPS